MVKKILELWNTTKLQLTIKKFRNLAGGSE
jgi:hypothetical protein